ncbi:MAG: hypothetical protein AAGA60_23550 [Cyanobacteria bacterium P01_E01_bin.42]
MTLTQMYEDAMAELRQQIQEELRPQIQAEMLQQGTEIGEKQATLRLINNLLQVRFGEGDRALAEIVDKIASVSSEEFVPLLLQLSRKELLARFGSKEEAE